MYSPRSSRKRRNTTASILSDIATEGAYIEHKSWFEWLDNLMAGTIKVVFSIGSAFVGMLKYMNDIKPKGFLTFMKIVSGPFWNIIDSVAYFFSGFNKIRQAKSFWDFFDGFFDIFMGVQLLTLTIVSLFALPFLAQLSFAACMWHMAFYSFGKFINNLSNKEESNLYNFLDFSAWLCASIGTTLLGIAPFCPIATLPIVVFYALAGFFKGIQAGIDLYKWIKHKFSSTSEFAADHNNKDAMHKIKNYQSPTSTIFNNISEDRKSTTVTDKRDLLTNDDKPLQAVNDRITIVDSDEIGELKK